MYSKEDYLMHYGVLGMKWGHRKAEQYTGGNTSKSDVKKAKKENKKAFNQAYKNAIKANNTIIGKKRRALANKKLEDSSQKFLKTNEKYDKIKKEYKSQKAYEKINSRVSKKTQQRINNMSTGKAIAQSFLLGSYGSLVYNSARAKGKTKGKAVTQAIVSNWANNITLGQLSKNTKW